MNKRIELQPSTILLLILILYIILYVLFVLNKVNEADKTLYDSIGNILGLGINAMTIYFVYKTYKTQKEQIESQEEELKRNKEDVEYNRALDITYRQLEYTNKRFKPINSPIHSITYSNYIRNVIINYNNNKKEESIKIFNNHFEQIISTLKYFNTEFTLYKDILSNDNITLELKKKIISIICWNMDVLLFSSLQKLKFIYEEFLKEGKITSNESEDMSKVLEKVYIFINAKF